VKEKSDPHVHVCTADGGERYEYILHFHTAGGYL
jgi:hypothetical protein